MPYSDFNQPSFVPQPKWRTQEGVFYIASTNGWIVRKYTRQCISTIGKRDTEAEGWELFNSYDVSKHPKWTDPFKNDSK